MFSGLFVVVALVVLPFRVQATTTVAPSATTSQVSSSVSPTIQPTTKEPNNATTPLQPTPTTSISPEDKIQATTTVAPSATTSQVSSSVSPTIQPTTEEPNNATTPLQPTPTTPISPEDKTCVKLTFTLEEKWTAMHEQSPSGLSYNISFQLSMLYNDTNAYSNVTASVTLAPKDGFVSVEAELCLLVVSGCKCVIEDVFKNEMKSGEVILIKEGSGKFEPLGVVIGEWKAKTGECKKCEGAAGPIVIERTCTQNGHSCNGYKTSLELNNVCEKYCSKDAGAVAVYCLYVLAIGIFLSFSFQ